jgi:gamma-glutamylcyclotransferase (GGCT)/AIG2-like uncharacterized protein YtfP
MNAVGKVANGRSADVNGNLLFIYGTLLPGQCRWSLLAPFQTRVVGPAITRGWLLDLHEYPGLVCADWFARTGHVQPCRSGEPTVFGQAVHVSDWDAAVRVLDEEEGCLRVELGFEDGEEMRRATAELDVGLYVRRWQPIILADGRKTWAWAYLYNQTVNSPKWIETGNWLSRG